MPKVASIIPKYLKPYAQHGMDLTILPETSQAVSDCPFCGKEGKWSANVENGLWDCKRCGESGNPLEFARKLWDISDKATTAYGVLSGSRKLLFDETPMHWGCCQSVISGEWLVPGWAADGSLWQLYRWHEVWEDGKRSMRLWPTSSLHREDENAAGLHGLPLFNAKCKVVYVCEGVWDAMALWELLRVAKRNDDGEIRMTGAEASSMIADASVIAVPGCGIFQESWLKLFSGMIVVLMYDSDHPKEHPAGSGHFVQPGLDGMRRLAGMLACMAEADKPESVSWVAWGEDGHDPLQFDGFDVRDALTCGGLEIGQRLSSLQKLLGRIEPIPESWVEGRSAGSVGKGKVELETLECGSWDELIPHWKRAMHWTEDLEHLLSVCLASVLSTESLGEQVWVMVMAPPSSGKTTIMEALAVARKHVHCKSTLKPVYSGYKADKEGSEDFGIIPKIMGKTFIIKDGDPLLKDPARGTILAQYRDLYDGVGRSQFNNGTSRDYGVNGAIRFTFILCGTAAMRELDAAEVGARWINCSIMEEIDGDHEREVNRRVGFRALRNVKIVPRSLTNGQRGKKADVYADADMTVAKQMTGGHVEHLRKNAQRLLNHVEMTEEQLEKVIALGELTAFMRAREPKKQDEVVEREFSPRLVEQFVRLTVCLAAVLGKSEVDDEVMARIRRTALDTARGRSLDVVRHIIGHGRRGAFLDTLAGDMKERPEKLENLLNFMARIKAVWQSPDDSVPGVSGMPRWKLTNTFAKLYNEACFDKRSQ